MKRLITAILIVGCSATFASADWLTDFKDNYKNKNIDAAVENAMKEGIGPDIIIENGLAIETLNPQNLIKALYCADVNGRDIYMAADKARISELIVDAGFKQSVEECGDQVADVQPYTPGNQGLGIGFTPGNNGWRKGFGGPSITVPCWRLASPWKFRCRIWKLNKCRN